MAFRKRGRPKKPTAHNGKLMIVLRNRHMVWIDMPPSIWAPLDATIDEVIKTEKFLRIDDERIRCEDIVHVKYIGPKTEITSEPEPKATPE